jgi:tetratricopeptide (TPR) repeat protein
VLLLLTLSLAIRLWGIHDRLPDASLKINVLDDTVVEETDRTTMGRAWMLWQGGTKPLDLNPHTGGWPALSFYLTLGIQLLYKVYYAIVSGGVSSAQFQTHVAGPGAGPMFLFARVVGALIGVLTVYLTYRVAAITIGRAAGLIAGLLLATNALHVLTSQHVSDPNLLALLFVLLATPPLLRVLQQESTLRDSIMAGAMIGLAGACKYVPLVLGLPLALAHIRSRKGAGGAAGPDLTSFFKDRRLWAGLLAIPVAFFVASPFLLIDWKRTLVDISGQRRSLFSDWVGQTAFPISLPTYLAVSLPHAMGWPAYLLGLAGFYFLWKAGKVTRMLVWIPIMIVLVNGMLKSAQERYILIALPFFHIAAAFAILNVVAWARTRVQPLRGHAAVGLAAPALLAVAAVAWPLPELLATRHALSLPDSRHLSRHWIDHNVDPNRTMVVELYGPVFNQRDRAFVIWPFFATQSQLARPAYHPEFLDGIEYHVASEEISRRFESEPEKYPVENAYYRWLRDRATVVWESDVKKNSGPHIVIRRVPPNISTRAQRDSVFRAAMPTPTKVNRVGLWCLDCAKEFTRVADYVRAEEWARRGLEVGVEGMEAPLQHQLAVSLWRRGQVDSAEAHMRIAVEKLPPSSTFRIYHASMLNDLNRHKEALEELFTAYELSNHDPMIHLNIAQTLSALGRHQEAVDELLRVPAGHSQRGLALRDAAVILLNNLDRPQEALNYLRESIQLDPNQEQADLVRQQIARLEAVLGKR